MKILYLTHQYFPHHVGGTEVYTRGLVRRAVAAGHQVRVISCAESPGTDQASFRAVQTEHEGVPVTECHFNLGATPHPARNEYDNPFTQSVVATELARFAPDLVHVMHALKLSGSALLACVDAGCPVVATLCDFWFLCGRHTLLDCHGQVCSGPDRPLKCTACMRQLHGITRLPRRPRAILRSLQDVWAIQRRAGNLRDVLLRASRIVALSSFLKGKFVANGYPADRIEVIESGLEVEELSGVCPRRQSRPLRRLGLVGSLVEHKGAHVLLEALAREPQLSLECRVHGPLAGGSSYSERIRALARSDPRVRLLGGFAPDELGRVLDELDLLAVPATWYENDPLIVKAALHVGLPVLASGIGTLEERIGPRGPQWLVEPGNPAAWAAALRRLAEAPLPAFAPQPAKSMDDNARELFAIYRSVA